MNPEPADKKQTLKLKLDNKLHFKLLGISSHENDYRLVWSINNQLNLQFMRVENLIVHDLKSKQDLDFSRYSYNDEDKYLKFNLISNRCADGFLFPQVRNLDFLLQITGEITGEALSELMKNIKSVPVISAVFILQPEKIKGIGKILME